MNKNSAYKYSVLMPLYIKDNPEWLKVSLDSMLKQSLPPYEIVFICDGPITDSIKDVLKEEECKTNTIFNIVPLEKNVGLGVALSIGIQHCSCDYVARMDADDYSVPNRCEEQMEFLITHPEIDLVGSNVEEFIGDINNVVSHVVLPEKQDEIEKFAKRRCPIRHPSLIYKKSAVLQAGNYRDYRHAQDYNLIVHMLLSGAKMYNVQKPLVYMRVSPDFYKRRGGIKQAKLVLRLKKEFLDLGFYSTKDFVISGIGNAAICVLPNKLREAFYKGVLRK